MVTLWMLESFSTVHFVEIKSAFILTVVLAGTAITVATAFRVAKSEGLLHRSVPA